MLRLVRGTRRWLTGIVILGSLTALLTGMLGEQSAAATSRALATPAQLGTPNTRPAVVRGPILSTTYDGNTDDLLTAGLGQAGLQAALPAFSDPANPTVAELRRAAIYNNYRAIVDVSVGSGYGTLYGPAVGSGATPTGKIAGKEYLAFADDGTGKVNVTMMVQLPSTFSAAEACIVTAPSSGSRGVYGAIGAAGEWGLKKGCAVAYTDKGTGLGVHDLTSSTVNVITGTRINLTQAGIDSNFTAIFSPTYAINNPNRIAVKHAHSQQNPERSWGRNVLDSVEFAFYVLNLPENFGTPTGNGGAQRTLVPTNTLVIGAGVSNGGGASLLAAEQDATGLIDGVAVSEPNVNPTPRADLTIEQGLLSWDLPNHSRSLLDYYTFLNVYAPCAVRATSVVTAPLNGVPALQGENRCSELAKLGLLTSSITTTTALANEALQRITDYGMLTEQHVVIPSHHTFSVFESIALLYTSAYGRFSVSENVCGYSYAFTNVSSQPIAGTPAQLAALFGAGSGIPPMGGIQIIDDLANGGPTISRFALSPSNVLDQNLDGALCLRRLATGINEQGQPLSGSELAQHNRVKQGLSEIQATGNLRGKPTIIVHGRSDSVIPVNYAGRAYFGLNQLVEGQNSQLRYYEILNAQHFDAFNAQVGFNTRFIPIHHYALQALDLLYANLRNGSAIPASQVITTTPRLPSLPAGTAEPITAANVPPAATQPTVANQIVFIPGDGRVLIGPSLKRLHLPLVSRE
jgi:hydroxybutyrate-dimer hydrolase